MEAETDYVGNPYFGEKWDAPSTDYAAKVATPVGVPCLFCEEEVAEGDRGFLMGCVEAQEDGNGFVTRVRPIHRECNLRMGVGGLHCWTGTHKGCNPETGTEDSTDPVGMTRRESAVAVWDYIVTHGPQRP